jgi:hypothetical protein
MLFLDTATLAGVPNIDEIVEHAKAKKVRDLGGDDPPICAPPFPRDPIRARCFVSDKCDPASALAAKY